MTIRRLAVAATAVLLLAACASGGSAPAGVPGADALAGSAWALIEFQTMDDAQGTIRPAPGQAYSVTFGADGRAALQLHCNRGSARWSAAPSAGSNSGALRFGAVALTRAMCPQPSLDTRLAGHLDYVRSYIIRDGVLSMSLMADGGIYRWRRLPAPAPAR